MRVYELLMTGAKSAMTEKQLREIAGMSKREFRDAVRHERLAGIPICSRTQTDSIGKAGYYMPVNDDDIRNTVRQLRSREREIRRIRQALEKACQKSE